MTAHTTPSLSPSLSPAELRRMIQRSHGLRTLALALGTVMVGCVFYREGATVSAWVLLIAYGLVWPHVVRMVMAYSRQPAADDERCFMFDTAMAGVWIALMQFNVLPSVVLVVMFSMTSIAAGGSGVLVRGLALMTVACGVTAAAGRLAFTPATDMPELLASLPLLVVFPVTLSLIVRRLTTQVRRQNHRLWEMSSVDGLSGLFNRRHWEESVNAEMTQLRAARAAMLLIDIDHFKHVNDQHGHAAGDELICRLGKVIRSNLREDDRAGRYGGDEFVVMLKGADAAAAEVVAERIRSGVACSLFDHMPGVRCTVSIGVASCHPSLRDAAGWVEEADAALYRAKLAGRNRFVVAS